MAEVTLFLGIAGLIRAADRQIVDYSLESLLGYGIIRAETKGACGFASCHNEYRGGTWL
jgi:hypothetical protein